jgi:hypothetical protein
VEAREVRRRLAAMAVLLALQLAASVMVLRRDAAERFAAQAVSALVWSALPRDERRGRAPRRVC